MSRVLIIDDDVDMCRLLDRFLTRNNFSVTYSHTGKEGINEMIRFNPQVILCDYKLDDTNGKDLLIQIKEIFPFLPVIIITAYSDLKVAVEVIKHGAFDYITKPLYPDEILATIKKAICPGLHNDPAFSGVLNPSVKLSPSEPVSNQKNLNAKYIFGKSAEFKEIFKEIDLVAPTNYSVIIYGESGSGKEVIAQEIHARSKRRNAPFIAIDCGALSKELAGSELFGHEIGSFTGALQQKVGSLQLANTGTVFLDEISNLPYDVQVSLLRVVQERKIRRVGGSKDIELDIRIIVASNEKLWEQAKRGKFREDLYHRFNEFSINVPPLRERKNDILTFAEFFLKQANQELKKNTLGFSPQVQEIFKSYSWPGNLRELKNVVKRSALLTDGDFINLSELPFELAHHGKLAFDTREQEWKINESDVSIEQKQLQGDRLSALNENRIMEEKIMPPSKPILLEINSKSLKTVSIDAEYEIILQALKKANYNKAKAARLLEVDRKTLYNKMRQYSKFDKQ